MKELSRTTDIALGWAPAQPGVKAPTTTPPVTFRKSRRVVMPSSAFGEYVLPGQVAGQ
jgi:hypothetical protein